MPPRKRNKKKGKGNAAPVEAEAATSASASETPVPASDASAAAQPPAEDNKVVDTSGDAPPAAGSEPAAAAADDATVPPDEPVPLSATPGLFEEGSVEPVDPHTPGAGPAVGSSDDTFGDGSSGYSRIKKDDISDAGSPAVVIDDDSDDVFVSSSPERPDNDPADEQSEPQSGETASETTAVQDDDTPAGAEASPDPLQSLFSESSRSPVNMALSDAEGWAQAFGSGSLSSSGSLSDRSAEVIRQMYTTDEVQSDVHDNRIALQDCEDKLDGANQTIENLKQKRNELQADLDSAYETLDSISEMKNHVEAANKALKDQQTTFTQEITGLKNEIEQRKLLEYQNPPPPDPDSPEEPPGGGGSGGGGPVGPRDAELRQLRADIQRLRDELTETNAALVRLQQRGRNTAAFRAGIAGCPTENDKLAQFGTSLDVNSPLYAVLLKLADSVDHGGPGLTRAEVALVERFQTTLAERKFVMAEALRSDHPRPLLEPRLDAWDQGEDEWGSTLRDRIVGTRQALDSLAGP